MKKKLRLNTIFGFINQILMIFWGLILPRLILAAYGSEINGLVNSITCILNVITLLELGVGAVVQSALYKPLADNDYEKVSKICKHASKFFRIVGLIFLGYVAVVAIVYPFKVAQFDFLFTLILVFCLSISLFSQYYFGVVNTLLLKADQKVYIVYIVQSLTIILDTVLSYLLIKANASIQIVKLATSLVYVIRPVVYYIYVKVKYPLRNIKPDGTELPQKWNGLAQHISYFILNNTDVLLITMFSTLANVSIYSVYYLVVKSLTNLVISLTGGIQSYYGSFFAINDKEGLIRNYNKYTYLISSLSILCFSIAISCIVPFILVYTRGITDANYDQFAFGCIILAAHLVFCFRYCSNLLIMAVGHYKQTQLSAIIEAVINLVISIVLIFHFGLIGVAIGTLIAMLYRSISFIIYISRNIIPRAYILFIKQMIIAIVMVGLSIFLYCFDKIQCDNYVDWIILALKYSFIEISAFIILNIIFNFKNIKIIIKR